MDLLQQRFTPNHHILPIEATHEAIANMRVYNIGGMKAGWRHLGAIFTPTTIKKAYPLCCQYEKSYKKINVPHKTELFAVAFACTRNCKHMEGRTLLEVPSHNAQVERWLVGALYYLLSGRFKRIQVVSDRQHRGLASQNSDCMLKNTRPDQLDMEEDRPVLRGENDSFTIILGAEELLVNRLCDVARVEHCIGITTHKLHAFERGHLEHQGFRMLDSGLPGKRDIHDEDSDLKARIATLQFRFANLLEAYKRS